jgi:glycosyltransferase involved in cell wall biosynthesis
MYRILSLEFENGSWSWGLIAGELQHAVAGEIDIFRLDFGRYRAGKTPLKYDLILSQNLTQLKQIKEDRKRIIARMGGNRTFDVGEGSREYYLSQMAQCGAVIATNQHLYNIAKQVNPNTFLITNGIDLSVWRPKPNRVWRTKKPIVGFVGNVLSQEKSEYKGYPWVQQACRELGLQLKEALYKKKQISHDQMMTSFYYEIDILCMPTKGEGTSNTILEVLSCGIPVVTTRCAGYHGENLTDGVNVIFCERNQDSVTKAIGRIIQNPELCHRLSVNGRRFAEEHHDIKRIADHYKYVFETCIKNITGGVPAMKMPPDLNKIPGTTPEVLTEILKKINNIEILLKKNTTPRPGKTGPRSKYYPLRHF